MQGIHSVILRTLVATFRNEKPEGNKLYCYNNGEDKHNIIDLRYNGDSNESNGKMAIQYHFKKPLGSEAQCVKSNDLK